MRYLLLAVLASCVTSSSPTTDVPRCAMYPTPADITCSGDKCSWRGEACRLDECGMPPAYPGYVVGQNEDGDTVISARQWNALATWIDDERTFQQCESAL